MYLGGGSCAPWLSPQLGLKRAGDPVWELRLDSSQAKTLEHGGALPEGLGVLLA